MGGGLVSMEAVPGDTCRVGHEQGLTAFLQEGTVTLTSQRGTSGSVFWVPLAPRQAASLWLSTASHHSRPCSLNP